MPTKQRARCEVQRNVILTAQQDAALAAEARRVKTTVAKLIREAVWSWMVGRLAVAKADEWT